jgi:hypothetical protein
MIDDQFHPVTEAWRMEDNQYVLNANQLPPRSEHFRLTLSGEVSQELLNTLVRIQPSINPNRDDTTDKYWLICHLKDTNILKKWWDELAVRDIAVGVKVTIRRCFSNAIPFDVVERLESMREWRRLGSTPRFDRQEVIRAHRRGIQARRRSVLDVEEIYKILMEIASAKNFEKYVTIDQPYQLFNVEEDKDYDFYPEKMNIDVSTELNYKSPAAKGYLTFKRKEYEESIKTRIEKEKEERSPSKRKKR